MNFLRCCSSDHVSSRLKKPGKVSRNSFREGIEARGNSVGKSSLYVLRKSPIVSFFSLRSFSRSGVFIDTYNTID